MAGATITPRRHSTFLFYNVCNNAFSDLSITSARRERTVLRITACRATHLELTIVLLMMRNCLSVLISGGRVTLANRRIRGQKKLPTFYLVFRGLLKTHRWLRKAFPAWSRQTWPALVLF